MNFSGKGSFEKCSRSAPLFFCPSTPVPSSRLLTQLTSKLNTKHEKGSFMSRWHSLLFGLCLIMYLALQIKQLVLLLRQFAAELAVILL